MKPIPDIKTFFYETSLYEKIEVKADDEQKVAEILLYPFQLDGYCTECMKDTIFYSPSRTTYQENFLFYNFPVNGKEFYREVNCTRNENHKMHFFMRTGKEKISETEDRYFFQKIGQFPAIADLSFPQLDQYKKILGKQSKEFHKAIGLFTHGVGIGSFVYLRRIFESIIEEAHQQGKQDSQWNEEVYNRSRMDDKIEILEKYLPAFLVNNRKMYGILSKGIHELAEEECLEYFPIVKTGITLILDEKIREQERQEEIKRAENEMSAIAAKLKNPDKTA